MCFSSKAEMKEIQSLNFPTLANVSCGLLVYETIFTVLRKCCLALPCKCRIISVHNRGFREQIAAMYNLLNNNLKEQ